MPGAVASLWVTAGVGLAVGVLIGAGLVFVLLAALTLGAREDEARKRWMDDQIRWQRESDPHYHGGRDDAA